MLKFAHQDVHEVSHYTMTVQMALTNYYTVIMISMNLYFFQSLIITSNNLISLKLYRESAVTSIIPVNRNPENSA